MDSKEADMDMGSGTKDAKENERAYVRYEMGTLGTIHTVKNVGEYGNRLDKPFETAILNMSAEGILFRVPVGICRLGDIADIATRVEHYNLLVKCKVLRLQNCDGAYEECAAKIISTEYR